MNNNQLIERKENIFTKIKNFFRGLFSKKKEYNCTNSIAQNIQETEPNNIEVSNELRSEISSKALFNWNK